MVGSIMNIRTDNVDVAHLADHGFRINLTHVSSGVFGLDAADVQMPSALVIVRDAEAADTGHNLTMDRQDHLPVEMHPRHLLREDSITPKRAVNYNEGTYSMAS